MDDILAAFETEWNPGEETGNDERHSAQTISSIHEHHAFLFKFM